MFNKLFGKILDSSIWLEPTSTRIVWITLLAAMDEEGYAHFSSVRNLAQRARVTQEEAEEAVKCFTSPDKESGNPENEGRRVERVPGGFMVLNAKDHRDTMNRLIEREKTRMRVSEWRAKQKSCNAQEVTVTGGNEMKQKVTNPTASASVQGEVQGEKKNKARTEVMTQARIVLAYLNEKAGRHYREVAVNLDKIALRLAEVSGDVEGVKRMIDRQCVRWKGDEKMDEYLRPQTLFTRENFAGYYDNRDVPVAGQVEKKTWQDKDVDTTTAGAMRTLKNLKL